MKTLAICFILLLAASPALAQSNCRLARNASIDLNFDNAGGVYVPMKISGTTVNLLVDTGGAGSMLTDRTVDALKLERIKMDRSTWLQMFGGEVLKYYAQPRDVELGGLHAPSLRMVIVPVGHHPNFDGTLAPDIMRLYDVDFDFANAKLNLFSQDHCPGAVVYWTKDAYAQIEFHVDRVGHIELPIEVDGHTLSAAFDTGSSESIMSLDLAKRLFDLDEKSLDFKAISNLPLHTYRYPFKTLKFGGVTVNNPDILLVPNSVSHVGDKFILGMGILRQLHLYIAYKERKLYVTPASADSATSLGVAANSSEAPAFPVSLHCNNPAMEGQFTSDGPDGFVTARMTFDINTTPAAGAVRVTPGTNSVCTVRAKEGFVIRSASFAIDSRDTDAAITRELLKHVEITEEVAGDSRPGTKAFVFTVKATDATRGKLVLDFPVSYR
jgi:predicted aspartyl protease